MIYIVSYDLQKPGQNYEQLYSAIKGEPAWAKIGESAYLVSSSRTAVELRDYLKINIDANDKLYVGKVSAPAAWTGMPADVSDWIKQKLED